MTDGPPFAAAQELLVVLQAPDRALGACAERRATHAERTYPLSPPRVVKPFNVDIRNGDKKSLALS